MLLTISGLATSFNDRAAQHLLASKASPQLWRVMSAPLAHVMYVEDEPDIQSIVKMSLETLGNIRVDVFDTGEAALSAAPALQPQLILLDVMMPGLDGPATIAALRKLPNYQQLPFVFITAKTRPEEIAALMKLGALAVLPKPFEPLLLANELNRLWRQFCQRQQPTSNQEAK